MLKELFENCAWNIEYQTAGNDVNYAFVEENEKLYIYFQGSSSTTDWIRNFLFAKKVYKMFRVHRGFYEAYSEVRSIILDKCYSKQYKRIIIVGYSHGGALTQIAFEDVKYHFPNIEVIGYAFESPRCLKVAKKYRYLWNGLFVIRNGGDLITHLPPVIFGYQHQGKMIKVKGDVKLVENKLPCCIKYHYPQCVYDGLAKFNAQ